MVSLSDSVLKMFPRIRSSFCGKKQQQEDAGQLVSTWLKYEILNNKILKIFLNALLEMVCTILKELN